jgi:phosphoglycolate phosphatase
MAESGRVLMNNRTVFFDLDGTLTDPKPGIVRSIQYALDVLGAAVPEADELEWCIGPPLKSSFETLLDNPTMADRAVALYRERFSETGLFENRVYEGIEPMLSELLSLGAKLHVATSKPHVFACRIIEHFGLSAYFDGVFGSELSGERSDKTELLRHALAQTGALGWQSTMVGDRSHDMVGAVGNDLRGVGVLYGYGTAEELNSAGAKLIVAEVGDLVHALSAR